MKLKKSNLSDMFANRHLKATNKKSPFEIHINRAKQNVIGRKSKNDRGLPGVSRSKAIIKRKQTLLQEFKVKDKDNLFFDKRIGERNKSLTEEEKTMRRFVAERMKKHKKKNIFNLNDEEILTHRGQSIMEIENFDDVSHSDDDSGDDSGNLDSLFVEEAHFGGGLLEKKSSDKMSHKDLIETLILESKKRKAEKRKMKEETMDLTEKLDQKWKDLLPIVTAVQKNDEDKEKEKEKVDDYDILVRKMKYDRRAVAGEKLKSQEDLDKEESKKLEEFEKERLLRMEDDESRAQKRSHKSADDLDYDYLVEAVGEEEENDDNDESESDSDSDLEEENNDEKTENEHEKNEEYKDEDSNAENDSESEDDLADLKETSDEEEDEEEEQQQEQEPGKQQITEQTYEHIKQKEKIKQKDKEEKTKQKDKKEKTKQEDKIEKTKQKDKGEKTKQEEEDEVTKEEEEEEEEEVTKQEEEEEEDKVTKQNEEEETKKQIFTSVLESKKVINTSEKNSTDNIKIAMVSNFEEFYELLERYDVTKMSDVISKMIKETEKTPGYKNKFRELFHYILQYVDKYDDIKIGKDVPKLFKICNEVVPHLYNLVRANPEECNLVYQNIIKDKYNAYTDNEKTFPNLNTLVLFKIAALIYSASDFRHSIITPCHMFMSEILRNCQVKKRFGLTKGLFICTLFLENTLLNKRFVPSVINFIRGILYSSLPKEESFTNPKAIYPFKSFGPERNFLVLEKSFKDKTTNLPDLKMKLTDFIEEKIDDDFKLRLMFTTIHLLKEFVENLHDLEAAYALFKPFHTLLKLGVLNNYPETIREVGAEVEELLNNIMNKTLVYLTLPKKKPKTLKLYEPKIEPVYEGKRNRPESKEKAEVQKIAHKLKMETKNAKREIRRDNAFLTKVRIAQQIKSDEERKRKVKELYADAAIQQHELKKFKKK